MELTVKNGNVAEELLEKQKKTGEHQNLGDFVKFGRYTVFIVLTYELLIIPQMFNMNFMIFAGFAAKPVSCGSESFSNLSMTEACSAFNLAQTKTNCTPQIEAQFTSLSVEVCRLIIAIKTLVLVWPYL
jgi:hypothetical protein